MLIADGFALSEAAWRSAIKSRPTSHDCDCWGRAHYRVEARNHDPDAAEVCGHGCWWPGEPAYAGYQLSAHRGHRGQERSHSGKLPVQSQWGQACSNKQEQCGCGPLLWHHTSKSEVCSTVAAEPRCRDGNDQCGPDVTVKTHHLGGGQDPQGKFS